MNFKIILFTISIINLSIFHPIESSSFCYYTDYNKQIYVDCDKLVFPTGICDHLMKELDDVKVIKFVDCEFSELSNIFQAFSKIQKFDFTYNNTLPSAELSQAGNLSVFVMKESHFKTTPISFSINGSNLELFELESNDIDSISLENATKLEFFSLKNTNLTHLPANLFKKSTNLTVVYSKFNKIESIDAIMWPNSVGVINFDSNKITKLTKHSFRNLTNLEILELNKNEIDNIEGDTFFELKNLLYVTMNENHIKELTTKTFAGLSKLRILELTDNKIETIEAGTFEHTPNVWQLKLNGNNISFLNERALVGLKDLFSLDLSKNPISEIDINAFSDLSGLNKLDISSGELKTINFNAFAKTLTLNTLDLSNNKISRLEKMAPHSIPDIIFKPDDLFNTNSPKPIKFGEWLSLLRKKFYLEDKTRVEMEKYRGVELLTFVEYARITWQYVRREEYLNATGHRLHSLNLSGNLMTAIENDIFADFKNLNALDISKNPINTLHPESFAGLHRLEYLQMNHCALTAIDFSIFAHLVGLEILDLSYNQLVTLTAAPLPSLIRLSLYGNQLSAIPLKRENVPRLTKLNVSNNDKNLNCSSFDQFVMIEFYCQSKDYINTESYEIYRDKQFMSLFLTFVWGN